MLSPNRLPLKCNFRLGSTFFLDPLQIQHVLGGENSFVAVNAIEDLVSIASHVAIRVRPTQANARTHTFSMTNLVFGSVRTLVRGMSACEVTGNNSRDKNPCQESLAIPVFTSRRGGS
jgi:hypothetical protein